jgi:hypothetical protein
MSSSFWIVSRQTDNIFLRMSGGIGGRIPSPNAVSRSAECTLLPSSSSLTNSVAK